MKNTLLKLGMAFILTSNYASAQTFTPQSPAGRTGPGLDLEAYEVFYSMLDQSIDLTARDINVLGTNRQVPVSFGAEKEGSSSKILRVMSPSKNYFRQQLSSGPIELATWFMKGLSNGSVLVQTPIKDSEGSLIKLNSEALLKIKQIDWNKFENQPIDRWGRIEDSALCNEYLIGIKLLDELFPESPFSFFKKAVRKELWSRQDKYNEKMFGSYDNWVPLYGESQKYIEHGHKELNKGWEVIFKPQNTYADFENQMKWFQTLMGSKTELFEAPGHQRVVMPMIKLLPEEEKIYNGKVGEVSRMILAYLVLRGLKGETGLLGGKHKKIPQEYMIANLSTGRGPIRLEKNRFYKNSLGVEFRTGMKDEVVRRFVHAVYASRLATNDMKDIKSISDWKLIPANFYGFKGADFLVSDETLKKALENWRTVRLGKQNDSRQLDYEYLLPLWNWQNAPFTKGKKEELQRLSKEFIEKLSSMENPSYRSISKLMSSWVTGSNLIADIENYITPKKSFDRVSSPLTVDIKGGGIDVNKIDLGNEFTARMPLKLKAEHNSQGQWTQTTFDMTPIEREARIKAVAETLQEQFTGSRENVTRLASGSHGHNLSIAYELKDHLARTWRVEWDGVGRDYDAEGNILEHTARGGHIEIVSPKYNPGLEEIKAVYNMMELESLVPDYKMGGSHINIDFEVFEKNPKALARFLTLFHQHRGMISFMFQHINRLRSAEPVEVSRNLDLRLRNFDGGQAELSQLFYNEKYFNSRQNRKTRYTQIDVSNYMGQVIPEKFVKPDFDVVKARFTGGDGWSKQFRVTKHKKLEFRLFDAAKDSLEAALQIKIVRGLLNKALNETDELHLPVQTVDHEAYVKNPQKAYRDLTTLVNELGLNYADYSPYVTNKLVINGAFMQGKYYVNWLTRANKEFPKTEGWGKALAQERTGQDIWYSDSVKTSKISAPAVGGKCERVFALGM